MLRERHIKTAKGLQKHTDREQEEGSKKTIQEAEEAGPAKQSTKKSFKKQHISSVPSAKLNWKQHEPRLRLQWQTVAGTGACD